MKCFLLLWEFNSKNEETRQVRLRVLQALPASIAPGRPLGSCDLLVGLPHLLRALALQSKELIRLKRKAAVVLRTLYGFLKTMRAGP